MTYTHVLFYYKVLPFFQQDVVSYTFLPVSCQIYQYFLSLWNQLQNKCIEIMIQQLLNNFTALMHIVEKDEREMILFLSSVVTQEA